MKGKPHKYGIKIYQLCEAKSGFVCNMEVYDGAHQTDKEYNTSFNVVNRLCDPLRTSGTQCTWTDFSQALNFFTTCGLLTQKQ
jgi:hypothetical protein